jgi:hypothetical protein
MNNIIFWNSIIETVDADVKGVREQYNCQGKPDGTALQVIPAIN